MKYTTTISIARLRRRLCRAYRCLNALALWLSLILVWTPSNAGFALPVQLNPKLLADQDVVEQRISPNNKYVVYLADQEVDNVFELYSVPIGGGVPSKLRRGHTEAKAGEPGSVINFEVSSDSRYVVYSSDQEVDGKVELYRVPITGGGATKLNVEVGVSGGVSNFEISPDSLRVVYRYHPTASSEFRLRTVLINGDDNRSILSSGVPRNDWEINPQGTHVVYLSVSNGVRRLHSYSFESGKRVTLSGNSDNVHRFKIDLEGARVFYSAQRNDNSFDSLRSTSVDGISTPRTHTLDDVRYSGSITDFAIDPASKHVVYSQLTLAEQYSELFSTPVDELFPIPIPLSEGVPFDGSVTSIQISPDSQYVTFRFPKAGGTRDWELYRVGIGGGLPIKLNGSLTDEGDVDSEYTISPDGKYVYYMADQESGEGDELYRVPISGGQAEKLNRGVASNKYVLGFTLDALGENIFYLAKSVKEAHSELFSFSINGLNTEKIGRQFPSGADNGINEYAVSPDGAYVVYQGEQNRADQFEIFSVALSEEALCLPITATNGNVAVVCL